MKFQKYQPVLVIHTPYTGWVGYVQETEDDEGYVLVRIFDNDGNSTDISLDVDRIKNLSEEIN